MKLLTILNTKSGRVLAQRAELADAFTARLRGLMGRDRLPAGGGMVITPCNSIHTFFMRFSIDAVFYDSEQRAVATVTGMKPFRATRIYRGARGVIELPAGTLALTPVLPGDRLEMTEF